MGERVWLITGASSGLGRAIAEAVLARGERVAAAVRNPQSAAGLGTMAVTMDVADPESVQRGVAQTLETFDRLDVLVNSAGRGLVGALEEVTDEQIRRVPDVDFLGPMRVMRAVLPVMRSQGAGTIVNIGAAAAYISEPGFTAYGGAKAALEAASESLALEAGPLGIRVVIAVPGPFRTPFIVKSMERAAVQMEEYKRTSGKFATILDRIDGKQPGDPAKAAEAIIGAVDSARPLTRLLLGRYTVQKYRAKLAAALEDTAAQEQSAVAADFSHG